VPAEVLDQSDIDALLNAVNSGEVESARPALQIFSRHRRDLDQVEIREYDFKRPERISKDQMRALQTLHETFARSFGVAMSGFLRTIVECRIAHVEQMTYAEFISSLPNPTSFNLVDAPPLDGQLCLEISPLIIYPIIDRLMGGSNRELFIPQRSMTLIEQRLIQRILDRAMTALTEAWAGVREIKFKLGDMESNPQLVQIVPPNEVVVVLGFELKMANRAGTMSLCIPFNIIEPIMGVLSAQNWFAAGRSRGDSQWSQLIAERLTEAAVEVSGVLARTTITINDLHNLEVGDLIVTEKPATSPVTLTAEGVPKFWAQLGQFKGSRALRIQRPIAATDRVS
jgi:flagellar motor switch protein FliM